MCKWGYPVTNFLNQIFPLLLTQYSPSFHSSTSPWIENLQAETKGQTSRELHLWPTSQHPLPRDPHFSTRKRMWTEINTIGPKIMSIIIIYDAVTRVNKVENQTAITRGKDWKLSRYTGPALQNYNTHKSVRDIHFQCRWLSFVSGRKVR